jgi:protein-S-isoprenylcysteine O-methyltransferase Ste14
MRGDLCKDVRVDGESDDRNGYSPHTSERSCAVSTSTQSSPWEFRTRGWIGFAIYLLGFYLGYSIDYAMGGKGIPTYVLLGRHWGDAGIRIAAAAAAGFAIAGFLIRWWGSSYHQAGVVFSGRIETDSLTAAGPYRYVRNPLYLGNLLQAIGISMVGPPAATVIILVALTVLLLRLISLEEGLLRAAHGEAYERYCAAVPRLIPRLNPAPLPSSGQRPNIVSGFLTELGFVGFAVWLTYLPVVNPHGVTTTFVILFYIAVFLFVASAIVNRRVGRARTGSREGQ